MRSFFRFVFLASVLLVVAMVSALTAMRLAIHGQEVTVPDVVGKAPSEARKLADQAGFQMEIERQFYSATIPEGRILSQLPPAGTKVRRGWNLRVAESLGPQRVEIPSVLGQSQRAAEMNIRRRGLDIGSIAEIQLSGPPPDQVLSQSPPPNASNVAAPKISLLVSATPAMPAFVMPNFVGQQIGTATQAIQDAGLRVGAVSIAGQPLMPPAIGSPAPSGPRPGAGSIVVSQDPPAGGKVPAGATINFQVQ